MAQADPELRRFHTKCGNSPLQLLRNLRDWRAVFRVFL